MEAMLHAYFQNVKKKLRQLKKLVNDIAPNCNYSLSESWLTLRDSRNRELKYLAK